MKLTHKQQNRIRKKIDSLFKFRSYILDEEADETYTVDLSTHAYLSLLRIEDNIGIFLSALETYDSKQSRSIEKYHDHVLERFYTVQTEKIRDNSFHCDHCEALRDEILECQQEKERKL